MRKKTVRVIEKPQTATTIQYRVRYILKDRKTNEVQFIGNSRECVKYLETTKSKFSNAATKGRWKKDGKDCIIQKVSFKETVKLEGEERKEAIRNAKYARKHRNRTKSARFGFNERANTDKTER